MRLHLSLIAPLATALDRIPGVGSRSPLATARPAVRTTT